MLRGAKDLDTWNEGVIILRHWMGRGPGQDLKLYEAILAGKKIKPSHAVTIMNLLHSFSNADLDLPETYETLIAYLDNEDLAIRGLAYWHLYRLVPAGRKIGYNPLATKEERQQAINQWQKLIPEGQIAFTGSARHQERGTITWHCCLPAICPSRITLATQHESRSLIYYSGPGFALTDGTKL